MSSSDLTISFAYPSQVCRAAQKDQVYQQNICSELSEVIRAVCGVPFLLVRQRELRIFSKFIYLFLTTLAGHQTLGEEYCSLLLSSPPLGAPPSFFRTLIFLLIECLAPYLFERGQKLFSRISLIEAVTLLYIPPSICCLAKAINSAKSLSLALFYSEGTYYHLSKRILSMRYLWLHSKSQTLPPNLLLTFRAISFLFISQLTIRIINLYRDNYNDLVFQLENSRPHSNSSTQKLMTTHRSTCPLCMDQMFDPALLPCGHLFCWACIHQATNTKGECPFCKLSFYSSRVVLIQNTNIIV